MRWTTSCIAAAALLLIASTCVFAAPAANTASVVQLDSAGFRQLIAQPATVSLISFCTARNGKCRELEPQLKSAAKLLASSSVVVAAVDCKAHADVCEEQGWSAEQGTLLRVFVPGGKTHTYKKELKAKEIAEFVSAAYPNHVKLLTAAAEKKTPRDPAKARVLLFTDKRETSALYKSLALTLHAQLPDAVVVAEVRKGEKRLLEHYGIGKAFPVLMVEPALQPGESEPRGPRRYEGKMQPDLIIAFVNTFLPAGAKPATTAADAAASAAGAAPAAASASATAATGDAAAAAAAADVTVPELVDESCVERHCGSGLCVVMLLSRSHSDFAVHQRTLASIDRALRADKSGSARVTFVWADVSQPAQAAWAQANLDLQAQDYPQLALLAARKGRMASYVGAFGLEGVRDFVRDVSKGRVKTVPFATQNGTIAPLPAGNACPPPPPPPKKESKPAASSSSSSSSSSSASGSKVPDFPLVEEGDVVVLSSASHDSVLLPSARPWVLLFHSGSLEQADEKSKTIADNFGRVAKNLKGMVQLASVDVARHSDLAALYGVDASAGPVVKGIAASVEAKTNQTSATTFPPEQLASADAKALRSFAQTLLADAPVLVFAAAADMQKFMGNVMPGEPFGPKILLFAKPGADDVVVVPDLLRSLSLEFSAPAQGGLTFGVASSKQRDLAQQLGVKKIPSVHMLSQAADQPGQEQGQLAVQASAYEGPIAYAQLRQFCQRVAHQYTAQKQQWAERAARTAAGGGAPPKRPQASKQQDEPAADLDRDEL